MTGTGKEHLVTNIASHVKADVKPEVMPRVIEYRASVHPDLGTQAATQLTGSWRQDLLLPARRAHQSVRRKS
jgi:catalase